MRRVGIPSKLWYANHPLCQICEGPHLLSPRLEEFLVLIADGLTNAEIARRIPCSVSNVSRVTTDIYAELNLAKDRNGLVDQRVGAVLWLQDHDRRSNKRRKRRIRSEIIIPPPLAASRTTILAEEVSKDTWMLKFQ